MLISSIIANAQLKADLANQAFYTSNDANFDATLAWEEIYNLLTEADDDYFVTSIYLTPSVSFTADPNRTAFYIYALPVDFYRLRMLAYRGPTSTGYFFPCAKMDMLNMGYTQHTPGYILQGQNLDIYDPYGFSMYNFRYYPSPISALAAANGQPGAAAISPAWDITYPNTVLTEYMVWRIAADIRRKQNQDPVIQQTRASEIMQTIKRQIHRDDYRARVPKDEFQSGNDWWN
jgi:hypothetical protein